MRIIEEYQALRECRPEYGRLEALLALPGSHFSWSKRIQGVAEWGYRSLRVPNQFEEYTDAQLFRCLLLIGRREDADEFMPWEVYYQLGNAVGMARHKLWAYKDPVRHMVAAMRKQNPQR